MASHFVSDSEYALYMLGWIERLALPLPDALAAEATQLEAHWRGEDQAGLESVRQHLWNWVDANGGPRITTHPAMIAVRMLLCLAYDENHGLQDSGFFEDLIHKAGVPLAEINARCIVRRV
jgi:hypothetical protein